MDGRVHCGVEFFDYVVAVPRASYDLTDDDVEMLLSGTDWHQPMLTHLAGDEKRLRMAMPTQKAGS